MPIYEYRCTACGKEFEETRPFSEATAPATCPACGGAAQRLVSGFASTFGYGIKGMTKAPYRGPAASNEQR